MNPIPQEKIIPGIKVKYIYLLDKPDTYKIVTIEKQLSQFNKVKVSELYYPVCENHLFELF